MKVKELIKKLQEFPDECDVFVLDDKNKYRWIMLVEEDRKSALLQATLKIL